jgi:hypothetical protein
MLSTRFAIPVLAAVAAIGLAVPVGAAVIDPLPIGPNEVFAGFVNDHQTNATIVADCVGAARTGHPAGGSMCRRSRWRSVRRGPGALGRLGVR